MHPAPPQGNAVSHASVVVSSSGAVCLSLSYHDFLRAFKEIMGLRQQVRGPCKHATCMPNFHIPCQAQLAVDLHFGWVAQQL